MKTPARVRLDFVAPVHEAPALGTALCIVGVALAIFVGASFASALGERGRLDAALGALAPAPKAQGPAASRSTEDNAAIERELSVPWSKLLGELEAASRDTQSAVALLEVEPDPAKKQVRITAEAKSLPAALAYLERLQKSRVLRYPMLESHERQKDDPEHPIRIKLAAEWRL
jgi:hypothetical protein